jgi:hypothetical protein
MISSLINTYWLTPEEQKTLCLSSDWEFWKVNKYSIQMDDSTCKKVKSFEGKIVGFNPKSGLLYQADFYETCFIKACLLSIFNGIFTTIELSIELIMVLFQLSEKDFLQEFMQVIWYAIGIQLACIEAIFFESVYGSLTISYLELKANRGIPSIIYSSLTYKHLVEIYDKEAQKHILFYRAHCLQPIGHKDDLLDKGDHTLVNFLLANEEEYKAFKLENRFEFIEKI